MAFLRKAFPPGLGDAYDAGIHGLLIYLLIFFSFFGGGGC